MGAHKTDSSRLVQHGFCVGVAPGREGVALGRALFATWVPQEGHILRGGCPRESTFCEGVALGRAFFATWVPQKGQILRGGCPR